MTVSAMSATLPMLLILNLATASDSKPTGAAASYESDDITNDNTPTFDGNAQAGHTVKVYDGTGTSDVLLGTVTADASGAWSYTVGGAGYGTGHYHPWRRHVYDQGDGLKLRSHLRSDVVVERGYRHG